MLISRKILQSYFDEPLPDSETIAQRLTMKAYEVEGIEKVGDDDIFDIDVLPNRASDSLSHIGVAREVGLVFELTPNFSLEETEIEEKHPELIDIIVENNSAKRFMAVTISLRGEAKTPEWMRESLEALGERSISPIVDITNYVMLTVGQPLHAYDLDVIESISGKAALSSALSTEGEELILLDGTELELTGKELLIKTGGRALGLAGVKGGIESGVNDKTKRILLESATFDPKMVRRTAKVTKTQTGASKRFENGTPADLAALGIKTALHLLMEVYEEVLIEAVRDHYPTPEASPEIKLDKKHPKRLLGVSVGAGEIKSILERVGASVVESEDHYLVTPPWYRSDLLIPVDLVEEVGRLYGLAKIASDEMAPKAVTPERSGVAKEVIRDILTAGFGYSEVITRAFLKKGEVELANPLATDTPFLRHSMIHGIKSSLELASQNAELLEIEYARIFEIGTVFKSEGESSYLTIGIQKTKNARSKIDLEKEISELENEVSKKLGIDMMKYRAETQSDNNYLVVEYDLGKAVEAVELMPHWEYSEPKFNIYQEFSVFPYTLRDIAVWTPAGTTAESVKMIIIDNAGELLRVVSLFDEFEKDFDGEKRTSFAFRLVFQSYEKTLSDEEVNSKMELISSALSREEGFEVR